MTTFTSSRAKIFGPKGIAKHPAQCAVQFFENGKIHFMMKLGNEHTSFRGQEVSAGHFRLKAETAHGEATLHRFEHDETLEGSWSHGTSGGMIRIKLIAG